MLPDFLAPYKHYNEEIISGVLDGIVNPELWKQIEELERRLRFMENFLETKGFFEEAEAYVEKAVQEMEDLPFSTIKV